MFQFYTGINGRSSFPLVSLWVLTGLQCARVRSICVLSMVQPRMDVADLRSYNLAYKDPQFTSVYAEIRMRGVSDTTLLKRCARRHPHDSAV